MAITSLGLIGAASASASDTVDIPVVVDVPRSDPVTGASLVFITMVTDDASAGPAAINFVADDATTDPFYNTCLFTDGLNHYEGSLVGAPTTVTDNLGIVGSFVGLICNPLVNGVHTLSVGTGGVTQGYLRAWATAYTGVNLDYTGPGGFATLAALLAAASSGPFGEAAGGWTIDTFGVATPATTNYTAGDLALMWQFRVNILGASGAVAWSDGGIGTVYEDDDQSTVVGPNTYSLAFGETALAVPQIVNNSVSSANWWGDTSGAGGSLVAGPGPICTSTPPPPTNNPVFHTRFRAGA